MLATSEEILSAWLSPARQLAVRVQVDQSSYGSEDVTSLSFDSGSISGEVYQIGSTYMNTVQIVFPSIIETIKEDQEVIPELGILVDGEYHYSKLGHFFITEFNRDRNAKTTKITASDKMIYMEGVYESKLTYSKPYREVALEIANLAGVEINQASFASLGTLAIRKPVGYTYRQAIGLIAQFEGGFASFNRDGELEIRRLRPTEFEVTPESYLLKGFSKNENAYRIGGITVRIGEEETDVLRVGSTNGSQVELENKVMTQTLLNNIWDLVKNLNYFPFELKWRGCPLLEAGDWMYVTDRDGKRYSVPNLSYSLSFNGGLSGDSKATTNSSSQATYKYRGSLKQRVDWLDSILSANNWNSNYYESTEPPNPKEGDTWFKPNGKDTEIWMYEKNAEGNFSWVFKISTATDPALVAAIEDNKKKVEEAQKAAEDAQKAGDDAQVAADQAKETGEAAQSKADSAVADASQALSNANSAVSKATDAAAKADQSVVASNQAKSDATAALTGANMAKENAQTALNQSSTAIADAKNALDQYAGLSFDNRNLFYNSAAPLEFVGNSSTNQTLGHLRFGIESGTTLAQKGLKVGDKVTFRGLVEISGSGFSGTITPRIGNASWVHLTSDGKPYQITKAETVEFKLSFTMTEARLPNTLFDFWLDSVPSTVKFKVSERKLEKGSTATPWSYAPEDVQVSFENLGNEIQTKVSQTTFDTLNQKVTTQGTAITANTKAIGLKADQTVVETLSGRVTTAEGSITAVAGEVKLKANQTVVDGLTGRVSTAEGSITTLAGQVALKAEKSYVDTVKDTVDSVRADLTVEAGKITALNTLTNGHTTQIGTLQSSYEGLSSTVATVVNSGDLSNRFAIADAKNATAHPLDANMRIVPIDVTKGLKYTASATNLYAGDITDVFFARTLLALPSSGGNGIGIKNGTAVNRTWTAESDKAYLIFRNQTVLNLFINGARQAKVESGPIATAWSPSAKDTTTTLEFSNLTQTVSVIQGTVANKAEQSQVTQLAGQVLSLVSDRRQNLLMNSDFREGTTGWSGTGMSNIPIGTANDSERNKIGYPVQKFLRPTTESLAGTNAYPIQQISDPESYKGKKMNFSLSYLTSPFANSPLQAVVRYTLDGTNYYVTFTGRSDYYLDISPTWKRVSTTVDFTNVLATQSLSDIRISISLIASRFTSAGQRCALTAFMATEDGNMYQWGYEYGLGLDYAQTTMLKDMIDLRVTKDDVVNQINISPDGVVIDGNKVQILADTFIDNAVIKTANIADLAVNTAKIANLAVSEAKIGNLAVSSAKIADAAITSVKIGTAAIGTAHIGDGVITTAKIGDAQIIGAKIQDATISSAKIINLDVARLSGDLTNFVKSYWTSAFGSQVAITANAITMVTSKANLSLTANALKLYSADYTGASAVFALGKWRDSSSTQTSATGIYIGSSSAISSNTDFTAFLNRNGASYMLYAESTMNYGSNTNIVKNALNIFGATHIWGGTTIHDALGIYGYMAFHGGDFARITVDPNAATFNFRIKAGVADGSYFWFNNKIISSDGWASSSLLSLKNVRKVYEGDALSEICKTDIVEYSYKNRPNDVELSPIIDDVHRTPEYYLPDIITDGKTVNMYAMSSLTWVAIKQLNQKIEDLERKLSA